MTTRLLYLHGLESGPNSQKAQYLRACGRYEVTAPQLPTEALIAAIQQRRATSATLTAEDMQQLAAIVKPSLEVATEAAAESKPHVVVGSSFGGGVACALATAGLYAGPMVLLAPAARRLFQIQALPARSGRTVILHGRADSVVPVADSIKLAQDSPCEVMLWLVNDEHRLHGAMEAGALDEALAMALK